jgi:hypothetical protein
MLAGILGFYHFKKTSWNGFPWLGWSLYFQAGGYDTLPPAMSPFLQLAFELVIILMAAMAAKSDCVEPFLTL